MKREVGFFWLTSEEGWGAHTEGGGLGELRLSSAARSEVTSTADTRAWRRLGSLWVEGNPSSV